MDGVSLNIREGQLNKLREIFPEVVSEEKIDWERLRATLGEDTFISNERYVLNWAGKSDAFRTLQTGTSATLAPAREESVNFDSTDNVFIEGENLEVLKVSQKAYFGKIKCIIIDPPYNTGNDSFIYPDKFSESKEEYMRRVGDKDEEGYLMKEGLFRKNSKENGQYHSNWLSMMYPRLFLARNLLRDDGVIFVHIDDNEVHNLRLLMNEIFGEENFIVQFIWQKGAGTQNDNEYVAVTHDYILLYAKHKEDCYIYNLPPTKEMLKQFNLKDEFENERGKYYLRNLDDFSIGDRPGLHYDIICPDGFVLNGRQHRWRCDENRFKWRIKEKRIMFQKNESGNWEVLYKQYLNEQKERIIKDDFGNILSLGKTPDSSLFKIALNSEGTKEIKELFGQKNYFDYPKPKGLLKHLLNLSTKNNDFILDFFAGSGTTAHAVLELNNEDGGNRKFILVQLPEKTDEQSEAYKAGYKTIADISKERIRRVINKIEEERKPKEQQQLIADEQPELDLGFKVFKLKTSNFKQWRTDIQNEEELEQQLDAFTDPVKPGADEENLLYELLLKSGYDLNSIIFVKDLGEGNKYYDINNKEIIFQLSGNPERTVESILADKPKKVIMLDRLFENNDQLKTNTYLQFKDAGVDFRTV